MKINYSLNRIIPFQVIEIIIWYKLLQNIELNVYEKYD